MIAPPMRTATPVGISLRGTIGFPHSSSSACSGAGGYPACALRLAGRGRGALPGHASLLTGLGMPGLLDPTCISPPLAVMGPRRLESEHFAGLRTPPMPAHTSPMPASGVCTWQCESGPCGGRACAGAQTCTQPDVRPGFALRGNLVPCSGGGSSLLGIGRAASGHIGCSGPRMALDRCMSPPPRIAGSIGLNSAGGSRSHAPVLQRSGSPLVRRRSSATAPQQQCLQKALQLPSPPPLPHPVSVFECFQNPPLLRAGGR